METENFFIESTQNLSRLLYLKTGLIILGVILLIHFGGQWRNPALIDYRISLAICAVFGILLFFGLTRTPFTRSHKIDYKERKMAISFLNLWSVENKLEIPFNQLSIKTDKSFGVKGYGSKWQLNLLQNGIQVYDLLSDENGFSEEQMNGFADKLNELEKLN